MLEPKSGIVTLDLHGCTVYQAKQAVDAALRDMLRTSYRSHPSVLRIEFGLNGGETDLVLREWI